MANFTPAPWYFKATNAAPLVMADTSWIGGPREIAQVRYHMGSEDPEVRANARLIAAAPDLLEACKILVCWARNNGLIGTNAEPPGIDEATLAIRKATEGEG